MPVFQLTDQILFPPPELAEKSGLLAVGGDLSPRRLLAAYRLGIFPWYGENDPLLWWFPSPRLVIFPAEFHSPRRLRRALRQTTPTLTINRAFEEVIASCADVRRERGEQTWITPEMTAAYIDLHGRGYCHSVECWQGTILAGGLYGLALGKVFFGESMFSRMTNASKFCLLHLVAFLQENDYELLDCQMTTAHLQQFGAREISGPHFLDLLKLLIPTTTYDSKWPHEKNDRYGIV